MRYLNHHFGEVKIYGIYKKNCVNCAIELLDLAWIKAGVLSMNYKDI